MDQKTNQFNTLSAMNPPIKTNAIIIIVILILIIFSAGTIYIIYNNYVRAPERITNYSKNFNQTPTPTLFSRPTPTVTSVRKTSSPNPTEILLIPTIIVPLSLDTTSNWNTYNDSVLGFSFKYPTDIEIKVLPEGEFLNQEVKNNLLTIQRFKLDTLYEMSMGYGSKFAIEDRDKLSQGRLGGLIDWPDWPFDESKSVVKISNKFGKVFSVFMRFEVCDVTFERMLIIYKDNYRIILTLHGVKDKIMSSMTEYFKVDRENCGESIKVWDSEKMTEFYQVLENGKGGKIAQAWFDGFNSIIRTIDF